MSKCYKVINEHIEKKGIEEWSIIPGDNICKVQIYEDGVFNYYLCGHVSMFNEVMILFKLTEGEISGIEGRIDYDTWEAI